MVVSVCWVVVHLVILVAELRRVFPQAATGVSRSLCL